jgi:poly-gamma-glutamate synthase PgsB/CapB
VTAISIAEATGRVFERLAAASSQLDARLRHRALGAVAERVVAEVGVAAPSPAVLIGALARAVDATASDIERQERVIAALAIDVQAAVGPAERREVLARFLRATVGDRVLLAGDMRALERWLDFEAIQERLVGAIADRLDEIEVSYRAMPALAAEVEEGTELARVLADAAVLPAAMRHAARARAAPIRVAALGGVAGLVALLPAAQRLGAIGVTGARQAADWARSPTTPRWARVACLEIVANVFGAQALEILAAEVERRDGPARDAMILRRHALRLVGELPCAPERRLQVARLAATDPSEHVRQELARVLGRLPLPEAVEALGRLTREDGSARVRGVALQVLAARAQTDPDAARQADRVLTSRLADASDSLDLRVALEAIATLCAGPHPTLPRRALVPALSAAAQRAELSAELTDATGALLLRLQVDAAPLVDAARRTIEQNLATLGEGQNRLIELPQALTGPDVERALAVAARGDHGAALHARGHGRWALTRGEPRGLRAWRLVHELVHPRPDKRKGFVHTHARRPAGEIVAPPVGMAEVTPTTVPGERQLHGPVGGWGPFLPRVDDLLAACASPHPLRTVTARGTVTLRGPQRLRDRVRARLVVSLRYAELARERDRCLVATEPAEQRRFAERARSLGFSIELGDTTGDVDGTAFALPSSLAARFLSVAPPFLLPGALEGLIAFVLSPWGSSPAHLAVVAWLVIAYVILSAAWTMGAIERARRSIPLTIGGWGTRGKSGSERLKAALMHGLRYDVVVKTTGCEAMFIHARRDLPAQELFLHRPYDKATIWEQRDVLRSASRLGAQVFLWECMALQPRFVELLSGQWLQDEVTTLTNAYPDHEDVMGPSGEDVARVIGLFIPRRGVTFTSEEQMLPLLRDAARAKGTRLVAVEPLEADLLPLDLLARLPYDEHPRNVALILALAAHFGVDRERALVEMGDHVVPDLGVLKTYPNVRVRGRTLTFSNGMSANERAGFLSNWMRLGFDRHDPDGDAGRVTMLVVNNRADRVPRSRVFAEILVRDVAVDHIVCIGTNLDGLRRFVEEALDAALAETTVQGEGGTAAALARFESALRPLNLPRQPGALDEILARLVTPLPEGPELAQRIATEPPVRAAVDALDAQALRSALEAFLPPDDVGGLRAEVIAHAARAASRLRAVRDARAAVEAAVGRGAGPEADQIVRKVLRALFLERFAVVESKDATGDQVVDFLARQIPPGHDARVMGCQNIKGTGLDFVYRWLSIAAVRDALGRLRESPERRAETLLWFATHADYGLIDCREALATLRAVRDEASPEWAEHEHLLASVVDRLEALEQKKAAALASTGGKAWGSRVLDRLEGLVDHLDSVRRRRRATRILADLYAGRVGQGKAALLCRQLNAREKGGWLAKDYAAWRARRRPASV